jgi:hypothetical protein
VANANIAKDESEKKIRALQAQIKTLTPAPVVPGPAAAPNTPKARIIAKAKSQQSYFEVLGDDKEDNTEDIMIAYAEAADEEEQDPLGILSLAEPYHKKQRLVTGEVVGDTDDDDMSNWQVSSNKKQRKRFNVPAGLQQNSSVVASPATASISASSGSGAAPAAASAGSAS